MDYFISKNSIVRKIWGSTDSLLFIFAGAAAEFALNKAVDWLYFTGRLPGDPLGRLFSTVTYSQKILFSTTGDAYAAIDQITAIHRQVEHERSGNIPEWAYRDVLYLLIDYSIRAYELLERKLTPSEKNEIFDAFYKLGERMHLKDLPEDYEQWLTLRTANLEQDLQLSEFTVDLFKQYRKHLGATRYVLLKQVQAYLAPDTIKNLLGLNKREWFKAALYFYKISNGKKMHRYILNAILPTKYKAQIENMQQYAR